MNSQEVCLCCLSDDNRTVISPYFGRANALVLMACNFLSIAIAAVIAVILVSCFVRETPPLPKAKFHVGTTLRQFATLFRAKQVLFYI